MCAYAYTHTHLACGLDEVSDDGLALAQLCHGEGAQLVQLHDSGHGGEDEAGVQAVTVGAHHGGDLCWSVERISQWM